PYMTPADQKKKAELETEANALDKQLVDLMPDVDKRVDDWAKEIAGDAERMKKLPAKVQEALKVDPAKRNANQKLELVLHYRQSQPETGKLQTQALELRMKANAIQPVMTPIMKELPEKSRRVTKVHVRGDWLNLGKEVKPGVPVVFHTLPKEKPADRAAL